MREFPIFDGNGNDAKATEQKRIWNMVFGIITLR